MRYIFLLSILVSIFGNAQTNWKSPKYGYSIEIPKNFTRTTNIVGSNVDFKAENGKSSVVIVVKIIPKEFVQYSIWETLGDLDSYAKEWEDGANEYFDNPKVIKYGKTTINGLQTFWLDYTTSDGLYSKNYSVKKGNRIYTITLSNLNQLNSNYSSIWHRFKNSIKF